MSTRLEMKSIHTHKSSTVERPEADMRFAVVLTTLDR